MTMILHTPTLIILIIVICVTLATSIAWISWENNREGLQDLALGLFSYALGFILMIFRGHAPGFVTQILPYVLTSVMYALYFRVLHRFFDRTLPLRDVLFPPALMGLLLCLPLGTPAERLAFSNSFCLIQGLTNILYLAKQKINFPTYGRKQILVGGTIAAVVSAMWIVSLLCLPQATGHGDFTSPSQGIMFLVIVISLIFITNGYVLMTKERSDATLRCVAMKDRLTGCWNRIRIEEIAEQELSRLTRYGHPVSLMMIDIDLFKQVNDRYGHTVGDAVLRAFGELARAAFRTTDVIGRWGGEEFVIILPSCSFQDVLPLAERFRIALQRHAFESGLYITASIGIALARSTETWQEWLNRADTALYTAKTAGRNRTHVENIIVNSSAMADTAGPYRLQWSETYRMGNTEIDHEHKEIFETANTILALKNDTNRADILAQMEPLLTAVRNHFDHEQRVLFSVGAEAEARSHGEAHQYLIRRAVELMQRFNNGTVGIAALCHFLVFELIAQHMLIEDRNIAEFIAKAA